MSTSGNPLTRYGSGAYGGSPIEVLDIGYYLNLVTSEYRNSPKFLAFLKAILKKLDDVSQCQVALDVAFDVSIAVGVQLDALGVIVGVNRQMKSPVVVTHITPGGAPPGTYTEFPDYAFRLLVQLFIAMNSWDGTIPGVYKAWNTVLGALGYGLIVQDNQDMTMYYVFMNPPTDPLLLAILSQGYFNLKPAGVNLIGYFTPSVPGTPAFGFGIETSVCSGWNVGSWLVPLA